ncbi:endonuclease MutS2 [Enterococcus alcedinis]|uniref:Endonuclease MutS2 n=1 Tax=Enterococcus alcedinis TaxID=1274384 RepID=A0A917JHK3_9ENTE|nr:endonuclease MutS2 [Enterococcus alcedinis]MBP2102652.1 dsDNA-specific endonuclease/ATPase MutS2 [Enterococcus alcedinis]GGI66212.1 endonuclease MutS2 [Enterococcus alcedinis]
MNQTMLMKLQYNQIIEKIQEKAIGEHSKALIADWLPPSDLATVQKRQTETKEARIILDSSQHVPFMGLSRIVLLMDQVRKGLILTPSDLVECGDFLRSSRLIMKFFEKNQYQTPTLYAYSRYLPDLMEIETAIETKISNQKIVDTATTQLAKIRRKKIEVQKEIQEKLMKFIRHSKNKEMIQESMIVKKGEHYTVPIKASYKNKVAGTLIEESNKGQTAFIEPSAVSKLNEQLNQLVMEETMEEYQILAELTGYLAENETLIDQAIETITVLDCIFARGKYSREINGITPKVNKTEYIHLIEGRHPFLPDDAIPLNFEIGETYRGLVITGANAGGKTVVLKTIGLLTLMAMLGLQVPAKEGTELAVFDHVFVDIGDQQNLENALSTFSGHLKNIGEMLPKVKRHTLVLFDEIGSGTEPNEGAALAVAIMDEMYRKGALVVATTHYGEVKRFAQEHEDFIPAAMAFDQESLSPLYRLIVGQVGESQALWIAQKMNLSATVLEKAQQYIDKAPFKTTRESFSQQPKAVAKKIEALILYQKGDRVEWTENKKVGLVYQDDGQEEVQIFVEGQRVDVLRRRIRLLARREELYPQDYDLEQLFTDFHERKQERDLLRGSKKAHKRLDKEAKARRKNQ